MSNSSRRDIIAERRLNAEVLRFAAERSCGTCSAYRDEIENRRQVGICTREGSPGKDPPGYVNEIRGSLETVCGREGNLWLWNGPTTVPDLPDGAVFDPVQAAVDLSRNWTDLYRHSALSAREVAALMALMWDAVANIEAEKDVVRLAFGGPWKAPNLAAALDACQIPVPPAGRELLQASFESAHLEPYNSPSHLR